MKLIKGIALVSAASLLAACGSDDDTVIPPPAYSFSSVVDGTSESSVSYSGQATRHALISELKALIGSEELYNVSQDEAGKSAVLERLMRVYAGGSYDSENVTPYTADSLITKNLYTDSTQNPTEVNISLKSDGVTLKQSDYTEMSSKKILLDKMAGQDNDLSQPFFGWTTPVTIDEGKQGSGIDNERDVPHSLILEWFEAIADLATDNNADTTFVDPATGHDYQQLVQKFLLGAVTYSQAAEDYLKASKGLLDSDNTQAKGDSNYSALEHAWDEGFGYFGAGRDYVNRTDLENKGVPDFDQNQDGLIDLYSEYNFGHSVNAVKRDLGAEDAVDFSTAAFNAFLTGRQIIQDNYGTNPVENEGYHLELVEQAEIALENWEKAIAATAIHYINDVIAETQSLGTDSPADFDDRAKHWSEMKGFALSLQFSPIATISMENLATVLENMDEQIPMEDSPQYVTDLEAARTLLKDAYGFSDANTLGW